MEEIQYSGLTLEEYKNQYSKKGNPKPEICYICKRKKGDTSFGVIENKETGKIFYNKPIIDLGKLKKNLGQGLIAVYLICQECAFLFNLENEVKYSEEINGD